MEELYSDLENYNEVNAVEELRNVNKDLKLKLEEYETAMEKLKKDYDNLSMEFHTLQTNYSSLLKTARAEVERKTNMITQLNHDKDEILLKALQGNKKMLFNRNKFQKGTPNTKNNTKIDTVEMKSDKKAVNEQTKKASDVKIESSTNVTAPKPGQRKVLNIVDNVKENKELFINMGELKNVLPQNKSEHKDAPKINASSIKNRRKSMPGLSFSRLHSDEDDESKKSTPPIRNESPPTEKRNINQILQRVSQSSSTYKIPLLSGVDAKNSNYQELPREGYRSRISAQESEKHKMNDRSRDSGRLKDFDKHRGDKFRNSDKYREGENYRESFKSVEGNKFRSNDKNREGDRDDSVKNREGDKYRESYKSIEGKHFWDNDKYREDGRHDSNKYREGFKSVESNNFRDLDKNRAGGRDEREKFRGGGKYSESFKSLEGNKFRDNNKSREGHRHNDRHIVGDKYWDNDKNKDGDRYKEGDKFRETDRYRESDRHRVSENYRGIDKEFDKHRDGDRFRDRNRNTPDRPQKRSHRDCQDEYRSEYGNRHRVLESPEASSHSSHRRKSKSQESWAHLDRRSYDSDSYKSRYDERLVNKHSNANDYDEPSSKRQRVESVKQLDDNKQSDIMPKARLSRPDLFEVDVEGTSCQSPDAAFSPETHTDATFEHTIKEIRNIAVTPLEDPRVTSNKYVVKAENGKTTLTTAVSKTIDIKPVDKSLWNIPSVAVPDALLNEPQTQLDNEHIHEIYMDIDVNPNVNISIEPGEIYDKSVRQNCEMRKQITEVPETTTTHSSNVQKVTCKIPILKQDDIRNDTISNKDLPKIIISEDQTATKKVSKESQPSTKPQSLPHIDLSTHDYFIPTTVTNITHEAEASKKNRITLSDMAMVQDDLELSDETSDNVDLHKHVVSGKETIPNIQPTSSTRIVNLENINKSTAKTTPKEKRDVDLTHITPDDKRKETDDHKKQKNKRRKTKSKEEELSKNTDVVQSIDKKIRVKKDKEPKNMQNKFTDLFGDSSSLITPEDLGIPAICVPLCEDAQDAVDVNIQDIIKVPVSSTDSEEVCNNSHKNIVDEVSTCNNIINPNTEDKEIEKRIEEQIASSIVDTNTVYQNINIEAEKDKSDVVKTVIISSGVQPQFSLINQNTIERMRVADVEVNIQNIVDCRSPAIVELKKQNPLIALATSTPHKEISTVKALDTESKTVQCINNSNDSRNDSVDTVGHSIDKSDMNTQNCHDAPDVRIFVRRRRKGARKT